MTPTPDAGHAVTIKLVSRPPGATVRDVNSGESLGATPLELQMDRAGERTLEFELGGHQPRTTTVLGHHPNVVINLDRR